VALVKAKRPAGVKVVIVLQLLSAAALVAYVVEQAATRSYVREWQLVAIGMAVAAFGFGIAIGLWRLQRWAWVSVMLWTGILLAIDLVEYLRRHPDYPSMVACILVVFYLNQAEVQAAFTRPRTVVRSSS
jgi:uncharacterized membrane protein (DUF2068 family)